MEDQSGSAGSSWKVGALNTKVPRMGSAIRPSAALGVLSAASAAELSQAHGTGCAMAVVTPG